MHPAEQMKILNSTHAQHLRALAQTPLAQHLAALPNTVMGVAMRVALERAVAQGKVECTQ